MAVIHQITAPKSDADDIVLVSKLHFANNDKVKVGDELVDLETSKTVISIEAPGDGFIEYKVKVGGFIGVGEVVMCIHDQLFDEGLNSNDDDIDSAPIDLKDRLISSAAEHYIKENDLDISNIQKNFITLDDLLEDTSTIKESPVPMDLRRLDHSKNAPEDTTELKVTLAKYNEIKALTGVQSSGLVSTIFVSVDVMTLSNDYETEVFKESDSYLPTIVFEASRLIKKFPRLNAYYDKGVIRLYDKINLGVAFDIDDGLKVCTLRETNRMSLPAIEHGLSKCIDDYMNRCLTPEQLTGSTFTVTDLSSFGVDGIIPLVNFNQSAILGISSIDTQLNRINLSLSFDHRVTEGKVAGLFLAELKQRILSHMGLRQSVSNRIQTDLRCDMCMKTLQEDRKLSGIGLIKIVNHDGDNQNICQTCLSGWT